MYGTSHSQPGPADCHDIPYLHLNEEGVYLHSVLPGTLTRNYQTAWAGP